MARIAVIRREWRAEEDLSNFELRQPITEISQLIAIGGGESVAAALSRAQVSSNGGIPNGFMLFLEPTDASTKGFHRLEYLVRADGRIVVMGLVQRLNEITPDLIAKTVDAGFASGDPSRLVVVTSPPIGGGFEDFDWPTFFGLLGLLSLTDVPQVRVIGALRSIRYRRLRPLFRDWAERGVQNPTQLRRMIETRTSWKTHSLVARLHCSERGAEELLSAIGYEFNDLLGEWLPGRTEHSRAKRSEWIESEDANRS